ncbi:transformer-SR ribonucleoprotein/RNA recognition motif containing protein [Kockiozyma suomiensis]|uniref:transformer-SR ribonucleoprotein/RNA recognition motif containing protein n=1 Tax=Kockiozyma suomiensis TaxID=1337062 RepID=UPI003342F015
MDYENGSRDAYELIKRRGVWVIFDSFSMLTLRLLRVLDDQGYDDRRSASPLRGDEQVSTSEYHEPSKAEEQQNKGDNLFVTGIAPRVTEDVLSELFGKYGAVEKCEIMTDPHSRESRGFGFVKFESSDQAELARENLQGHEFEGRALNIEVARRSRPRTPTPGKYFGPRRREPPRRRPRYDDRYRRDDDRRRYGGDHYDDRDRDRDRYSDRDRGDRGGDRYRDRDREDRYRDSYRDRERGDRDRYSDRDRGYSRYDDYSRSSSSRYDRDRH